MSGHADKTGSVALEYLVSLGMAVPFLLAWLCLFEPGSGYTKVGRECTNYFQRMLTGISLPLP